MVLGLGLRIGLALGLAEDWVSSITAEMWSKKSFVQAGYLKTRPTPISRVRDLQIDLERLSKLFNGFK